ncbi:MAG: YggS family pyridoxal phosphate-dependent enzyme [Rhodoferax sp.]
MTMIAENLHHVQTRIAQACAQAGRASDAVALLAVSKTFGADAVTQAHAAGQLAFGENYIQEAVEKIQSLRQLPLEWHCIGPIQSNKSRLVAEHFDWVHTIDRLKIAQRLSDQRPDHLPPLQVCIQINVDGGPSKSGVPPQEALALAQAVAALPRLQLRGVMCIPEPAPDFVAACSIFARARGVFDVIQAAGVPVDTLSMGMSGDVEAAIASGSTMVRVGSAIFGGRAPLRSTAASRGG